MRQKIYVLCCSLIITMSMVNGQEIQKTNWITNGPVYTVTQNSDQVFLGGYFDLAGKPRANGVVYNTTTGEPMPSGQYFDNSVTSSASDGHGGFFVAGSRWNTNTGPSFGKAGDLVREGLAHILPSGEISTVFNPVLAATGIKSGKTILAATNDRVVVCTKFYNPLTKSYESKIHCLGLDGGILWERNVTAGGEAVTGLINDGTIYIGGRFTAIEGQSRQRAAALDLYTGALLPWNTGTRIPLLTTALRQPMWLGIWGDEIFIRYSPSNTYPGVHSLFSADRMTGAPTAWSADVKGGPMIVHHGRIYYATNFALNVIDATTKLSLPVPSTVNFSLVAISAFAAEGETIYVACNAGFTDNNDQPIGSVFGFDENTLQVQTMSTRIYKDSFQYGTISTISAHEGRLFVGGSFASIGMKAVTNLIGYDRQSGELTFSPTVNEAVTDLEAFDDKLYMTGWFWEVNGTERVSVACVDLSSGQLTPWYPEPDAYKLTRWNDRLYISGYFTEPIGMMAFDGNTGDTIDWQPQNLQASTSFAAADESGVYVAGYDGAIHAFSHDTGAPLFPSVSTGGAYITGLAVAQNRLFVVGHYFTHLGSGDNQVSNVNFGVVDLATGLPMPTNISIPEGYWAAASAIATDGATIYIGGDFSEVSGLSRRRTAAINAETLLPTDWSVPLELDHNVFYYPINSISVFPDGVYILGEFATAKGIPHKNVAVVSPDQSNVVSGTVFLDGNGNGTQDADEQGVPNILIELQPGNIYYPTDADGHYTLYTGVGNYTVSPVHPTYALSVNPGSINLSFVEDLMTSDNNNFAVVPYPSLTDDEVKIISDRAPRPGFEYEYSISYRNGGTVNSSGVVSVTLDPRLLVEGVTPPATNTNGNILEWTYSNLAAGAHGQITINARVPAPTINGSLLGEHIVSTATITPAAADNNTSNNTATLDEVVIGSVDPNDKLVTPQGYGPKGYIDEDTEHLTYTIRFQNVGTAPAENIYLEDQFDLNLDVSSFTVVESSHPNFTYYIDDRTLHVSYLNINLVDSVSNEPESHGFFTFTIGLNDGLTRGTVIQNSASIVFDYNLPLATNTVTNTLRNPPYPVLVFAGSAEASLGEEISIPVKVNQFENVLGGQFSVSWDPAVIEFENVEGFNLPGLTLSSFGLDHVDDGHLSFAWNDPNIQLQTRSDSTAIFTLRFSIAGDPGDQSLVSISQSPTPMEFIGEDYAVMESERADGLVTIKNEIEVAGQVLYPNDEPVQNVTINVSGSATTSAATNGDGEFKIVLEPENGDASYTLAPSKADDPNLLNGVDVQDVAAIRRHILQTELLSSPFSIIAADVSDNQSISIQDVLILQAVILGVESNYPNERQWTFVDAAHEFDSESPFPYPQSATPTLFELASEPHDFTAVKIGDVNFNRDNTQSGRRNTQEVVLEIGRHRELENGNIEVDIKSFGFIDISAYQFTLQWNHEHLRFVEAVTDQITSSFGSHRSDEGILTTLWDDPAGRSQTLVEGSSLMKIRFEKISDQQVGAVTITGNATPIKMYDERLHEVILSFREGEEEKIESGFFYPNPFVGRTKISFSANESQAAVFEVIDVMGKRLDAQEVQVQKGWNEISYNGLALTEGVYIFKLQLKDKRINAKVIKQNR